MSILQGSSNKAYHADRTSLSSSNLKMILENPYKFYDEWVLGNKPEEVDKPYFVEGSFFHTLVLEPELISDYAIFPGLRKAGHAFEDFKKNNPNKQIISAAQTHKCEMMYKAYATRKEAMNLISGGLSEHTMMANILGVPIKTRADYINVDKGYIVDVKTTSYGTDIETFREIIRQYKYQLSAALYCQAAFEVYNKLFDFYFVVVSKSDLTCDIYKASSETLSEGAAMFTKALVLYKKCKETGIWAIEHHKPTFDSKDYEILDV